jgi:VWFA-related protein
MSAAEEELGYERLAFEDGSSYVLPTDFTVSSTFRGTEATRNVVQLSNCHKFRALARMVFTPSASNEEVAASQGTTDPALVERELEQNNQIYAILREQAVREDAARLEAEQTLELNAATVEALWKLAGLKKQRPKTATLREIAQGAPALPASDQQTDPVLTLKTRVNLVQVSVVLRDAKGRAVGNLRKEDFQLLDDRKLQPIKSFSVEQSGMAKAEQAPTQGSNGIAAAALAESHKPASAPERDVAYLFDDLHSAMEDLAAAKESAGKQLVGLRAGDRVAVISTSGEVQVDFTDDREKLRHALQSLKPHPILPSTDCPPPVSYFMADLMVNHNDQSAIGLATDDALNCTSSGMNSAVEVQMAKRLAMAKAFEMLDAGNRQSRQALSVLQDVIRRTAAMPGERSIVLVSPGFLALAADVQQGVTELIDQAISSNIVINAVDVRGLYTVGADANRGHSTNQPLRLQLDDSEARTQSYVMSEVASGTGGEFFHSNNDLDEGFRRTAGVPEYIYVLGFSPQKLDGKFHKLKVTVSSPAKLVIQARQGYYALRPASGQ